MSSNLGVFRYYQLFLFKSLPRYSISLKIQTMLPASFDLLLKNYLPASLGPVDPY